MQIFDIRSRWQTNENFRCFRHGCATVPTIGIGLVGTVERDIRSRYIRFIPADADPKNIRASDRFCPIDLES
jgi:hypothetical protein